MRQRIATHEQTLRNPKTSAGTAAVTRVKLFFRYIQYAVVHAFTLMFMHPTKSFVAIYDPRPDGVWQRSYIEHVAYRNRVRFASASGLGVLVTAAVASYTIIGLVFPDRGISPAYATTFTVNSSNDLDDGTCNVAHCSFREAINAANLTVGADTITFSSVMTIQPTSTLPTLVGDSTTIKGGGSVISGVMIGGNSNGLNISGDNVTVAGMGITGFGGNGIGVFNTADNLTIGGTDSLDTNFIYGNSQLGINILGGTGLKIQGNSIGQKNNGAVAKNTLGGIALNGGSGAQIGASTINVIADGLIVGATATNAVIYGNIFGVTTSGLSGNGFGVFIRGTSTTFGGVSEGQRNVVVASTSNGITVESTASQTTIAGNYIGVLADGTLKGNTSSGILVSSASGTTINSNTIVANTITGVEVTSVTSGALSITNNVIGISPASTTQGANARDGISLTNSTATTTILGNIIGNNSRSGILISNSSAQIIGNYIGQTTVGTGVGNFNDGVTLLGDVTGTVVGGSAENRNYIGANGIGLSTGEGSTGNPEISYNFIGIQPDGSSNVGNGIGVLLQGPGTLLHNVISGNGGGNVQLKSNDNVVNANIIGLNAAGDSALSGQSNIGINVMGSSSNNTIGAPGQPNTIAGNTSQINIDEGASGNTVSSNYLNCNLDCTALIDSGSEAVRFHGASSNTVADNYMGGGAETAVVLVDPGSNPTTGNVLTGNFIGVGTDGSDISGDTQYGIYVSSSDSNTIGTTDAGNTIAHFSVGIAVDASQGVTIQGNIFEDNSTDIELLNGANGDIQPPVILSVTENTISGTSEGSGEVDIYQDGVWVGSATSDGEWSLTGTFDTSAVTRATITDADGNTSIFADFTLDSQAPVSMADPEGGDYSLPQVVILTVTDDTDPAPIIYYTTNGSTPTTESSVFTESLVLNETTTLKFFAVDASGNEESVHTETYTITLDESGPDLSGVFAPEKVGLKKGGEVIHPECDDCTLRTSDTTPTFTGTVKKALVDYIVRLVLFAVSNTDGGAAELEKVFAKEKVITADPENSNLGIWKIKVPESKSLDIGEYVVKLGLKNPEGEVVKPVKKGLTIAVTPPAPVAQSPLNLVYTKTPDFIGNALNGTTVIARVKQDGVELAHCSTTVTNSPTGTGSYACKLPFDLPAGEYVSSVSAQDPVSGLISAGSETTFTISSPVPLPDNSAFSLVPGDATIKGKFLTTDNTPVFVGLAPNDTEVVLVVDGEKLFPAKLTEDDSGTGHWKATTSYLAEGLHSVYAVVRVGGVEKNRTSSLTFKIVAPTVVPIITTPINGARIVAGTSLTFTILGHEKDTVTLTLTGPSTVSVTAKISDDPSGIGRAVLTFDNGLPRGSWTASAVATDSSGKPSVASTQVSFTAVTPVSAGGVEPSTDTNVNSNQNTNSEVNGNENTNNGNSNENTNQPVNENENTNETVNGNENTNGELNTNENTNGFSNGNESVGNANGNENLNENTNQPPVTNPDQTPLPPTTPDFSFPEGVEKFPIYTKTPGDLTSDEELAVHVVLNTYLKEQLQILPATEEGNATYLVTNTTAENEPVLTVSQSVGLEGSTQLTSAMNAVRRLFSLNEFKQTTDVLIFRGTTIPYATVQLTIYSDPIVKIAQADQEGHWTMTVPAASLPPGEHTAYLKTSYAEAASDEVQIARFVVVQQEQLSNTTWLFIINLAVILIILLAAIFLQLRKRTQLLAAQHTPIPSTIPWKSGSVSTTKDEDKDDKKPKGPSDLGDVMGV